MCRINGIVSPALNFTQLVDCAAAMRDEMIHGGPDDWGVLADEKFSLVLGNRRLALIDLSAAGHQPMSTTDGKIHITFNGEVYNFREIRRELEHKGYTFVSHTDTEVILKAYEEWGEKSFEKFNGMFAFAIEDTRRQLLYLVRDPSGIKPLYYYISGRALAFASELRTFDRLPEKPKESHDWPFYFLTFGHIPEPYTTLENVWMLPRGSFLKYDLVNGSHQVKTYFNYRFEEQILNRKQAVELVRHCFEQAVERHLIADAPVGVFLSGGIDSSLIALVAAKVMKSDLRTLSVIFKEAKFSEQKYQQLIVDQLKTPHRYCEISKDMFIGALPDIFRAMDQPTTDGINTYFISKSAKEAGLKAVLSGLGADELFGGYPSFNRVDKLHKLQVIPAQMFRFGNYLGNDKLKKFSFLSIPDELGDYLFFRGLFTPSSIARLLDVSEQEVQNSLNKLFLGNLMKGLSNGNKASWMEMNLYMQNQLLRDSDVMSMWHSVELRVPFLDKELITLALQIDSKVKFGGKRPKDLLISAFEDVLPEQVWNRPKQGFTFPFQEWFKSYPGLERLTTLSNPLIKTMTTQYNNNQLHWSRLWAILLLHEWKEWNL